MDILHYVQNNWLQIVIDLIAALNIIAAGTRAMGWSNISDECQKIETAIGAMIQAATKKGV